jgi:hypothetical protein
MLSDKLYKEKYLKYKKKYCKLKKINTQSGGVNSLLDYFSSSEYIAKNAILELLNKTRELYNLRLEMIKVIHNIEILKSTAMAKNKTTFRGSIYRINDVEKILSFNDIIHFISSITTYFNNIDNIDSIKCQNLIEPLNTFTQEIYSPQRRSTSPNLQRQYPPNQQLNSLGQPIQQYPSSPQRYQPIQLNSLGQPIQTSSYQSGQQPIQLNSLGQPIQTSSYQYGQQPIQTSSYQSSQQPIQLNSLGQPIQTSSYQSGQQPIQLNSLGQPIQTYPPRQQPPSPQRYQSNQQLNSYEQQYSTIFKPPIKFNKRVNVSLNTTIKNLNGLLSDDPKFLTKYNISDTEFVEIRLSDWYHLLLLIETELNNGKRQV